MTWWKTGLFFFLICLFPVAMMAQEKEGALEGAKWVYLSWEENLDAAWYEVEIYPVKTVFGRREKKEPVYKNRRVFRSGMICPASVLTEYSHRGELYFRVRPIDAYGVPFGDYGEEKKLKEAAVALPKLAPLRRENTADSRNVLYPAYAFLRIPGAVSYDVAVYEEKPDVGNAVPLWTERVSIPSAFDTEPRFSKIYWQVRGVDGRGKTVGEWSDVYETEGMDFTCSVAVFGDSITHGGGLLTYGPLDKAYNYTTYLTFPVLNLGRSGDTTQDMVNRFDRDTAPFSLKYILILGGTNDLRLGYPGATVIDNLQKLQRKCEERNITPVFLTLPPIHPTMIEEGYGVTQVDDHWMDTWHEINAWIRRQKHIDVASLFEDAPLSPTLSVDGLHPDWRAKKRMGEYINQECRRRGVGNRK